MYHPHSLIRPVTLPLFYPQVLTSHFLLVELPCGEHLLECLVYQVVKSLFVVYLN